MNLLRLENKLNIVHAPTFVQGYDFNFELFFDCAHPSYIAQAQACVLRCGAIHDYAREYEESLSLGLRLVNTPEQHEMASELSRWYPLLEGLTPNSLCTDTFPPSIEIEDRFGWPVFIKGSRQTSKHTPELCVAADPAQYAAITRKYREDPILHWQKIAIREFIDLEPVPGTVAGKVRPSLEVRSFWWQGECVGWGQYWSQLRPYPLPGVEEGLSLAAEAARRLKVPFLVVDFARASDGHWLIVECNDAQESGYTAVVPQTLWRNILDRTSTIAQ